jgi:hypothetical protein
VRPPLRRFSWEWASQSPFDVRLHMLESPACRSAAYFAVIPTAGVAVMRGIIEFGDVGPDQI